MASGRSRAEQYLLELSFHGILAPFHPRATLVRRVGCSTEAVIELDIPDAGGGPVHWVQQTVCVLQDADDPQTWGRTVMRALADTLGNELSEAIRVCGRPLADPHTPPGL